MHFVALDSMRCCLGKNKGLLSACMSSWQPCSACSSSVFPACLSLRVHRAAAQTVVMLTYVLTLNWERESRRARATFTPPAGAPAGGAPPGPAAASTAADSGGAADGDLEQGALLNGDGGPAAQPGAAAAAVPDQPLGVAAGAGALAPGHEAPVRQALL